MLSLLLVLTCSSSLLLSNSEHCNHTLYQFFRAKALKLEAKLRQRDDELHSSQLTIGEKDKEILQLKEQVKEKQQSNQAEEGLRQEAATLRRELEKARADASSAGSSSKFLPHSFPHIFFHLVLFLS